MSAEPPYDPRGVANLLLDIIEQKGRHASHIDLQKLLYFAHGRFLIGSGVPLVSGYFEAWRRGPVHPTVYHVTVDMKYRALRVLKAGWGPFSYDPTKQLALVTLNAQLELFGTAEPTSLDQIRRRIIALSRRGDEEATANLEVTERLYWYALENDVRAMLYDLSPYHLSSAAGISYSFWLPMVLVSDGRLIIPFIDPRRTRGLTSEGRRFAFSMAHHRVRALYPDLANAELAIFRFPSVKGEDGVECRRLQTYLAGDDPLFSYEELDQMVAETYEIWQRVLAERQDERRRASGGRKGTLL